MTANLLPGSLRSAADLLSKLQRDAGLLRAEVTSDRFYNFVVTGYSLIDWIKHDPVVPAHAKADVSSLYDDDWLKLCGDVATAAKHFHLTKRIPTASGVSAKRGYGVGRFGKGAFGVGEEQIDVHLPNGTVHALLDLVEAVLQAWTNFFSRHAIADR